MALTIELEVVNQSGDLQQIVLRGTGEGDKVLTKDEILALISGSGASDEHVKVSATDPVAQYLREKIQAGSGVSIVETSDPLGDYLTISFSGSGTDELVKADPTDTAAATLVSKIEASVGIAIALNTVDPSHTIVISSTSEVIPAGTVENQILQWSGSAWVRKDYLHLIPSSPPKDPNYLYLSSGDKNMRYSDQDEVASQLVDDKGSVNGIGHLWSGTQAQYDALTPDPNTIYFIE